MRAGKAPCGELTLCHATPLDRRGGIPRRSQSVGFAALLGLAWSLAESDKGRRHYVFLAILLDN
jgi:hypothetical protein